MVKRLAYRSTDLAWLVPTKDRPGHVRGLLESLAAQTVPCGRLIVIASGLDIADVVATYSSRLPVIYLHCHPPGQIRQRNVGIAQLDASTQLVGLLDDDLVLEPDALEEMIRCWNRIDADAAGVGFNILNAATYRVPWPASVVLRQHAPGRVLRSGYNTRIDAVERDIRTQWLGGGYTVWKQDILQQFREPELNTRWAIGEDVRFSYPIGKRRPLYVCAAAKVHLVPTLDQAPAGIIHRYRGRKGALAAFYFASLHPELSRTACLGRLIAKCAAQFFTATLRGDRSGLQSSLGQAEAIAKCIRAMLASTDVRAALVDD